MSSHDYDAEEGSCDKPVEPKLKWGNSEGIAAPSETAKPLMHTEKYVEQDGQANNDVDVENPNPAKPQAEMDFVNEGERVVPEQKSWPR
ncbi:MAG: hypothetical protein LIP23_08050 [Planctomycetes bacterium]|nr:hypothetical protein [Planctomycetota bacterium]